MRKPSLLIGILAAACFTLCLNVWMMPVFLRGEAKWQHFGLDVVDEQYYTSLIRDAGEGYPNLGHASLKEHRDGIASSTYAPLLQGMLVAAGLQLPTVLFLGDLFFPFAVVLLLFMGLRRAFDDDFSGACAAVLAASSVGMGLLRTVTPQVTYVVVAAYLAVFFGVRKGKLLPYILRGIIVGLMVYSHALHASFFLIVEACDWIRRLIQKNERKHLPGETVCFAGSFLLLLIPKILITLSATDGEAGADTFRRLGMIPSHLPTAPGLQIVVLAAIALLWVMQRSVERMRGGTTTLLLTLLVGGFCGLHQSVLHGIDIIFGLYYRPLIILVCWIAAAFAIHRLWPRAGNIALGLMTLFSLGIIVRDGHTQWLAKDAAAKTFAASDVPGVLEWLRAQPGEEVILAPLDIANFIPVATAHYVAFNKYVIYQRVTDAELADRYVLQESLFPTSREERGEGDNSVFGLYAGNLSARRRLACRIRRAVLRTDDPCDFAVAASVYHQDVLRSLDQVLASPVDKRPLKELLQRFHVSIIVSANALPTSITALCPAVAHFGDMTAYRCGA